MHNLDPEPGPAGPDKRRRPPNPERRTIYRANNWHVEDGTATDGSGRPLHHNPLRRGFSPQDKLAILGEDERRPEAGGESALLRTEERRGGEEGRTPWA